MKFSGPTHPYKARIKELKRVLLGASSCCKNWPQRQSFHSLHMYICTYVHMYVHQIPKKIWAQRISELNLSYFILIAKWCHLHMYIGAYPLGSVWADQTRKLDGVDGQETTDILWPTTTALQKKVCQGLGSDPGISGFPFIFSSIHSGSPLHDT
jgi:hypothetical protein